MKNPFIGSGVALVTPFNSDFSIDFDALKKLVRYQIDNGTDFLVVQGTTGESPALTYEEKCMVLDAVQEENGGKLKIVFGVGGNDTMNVVDTIKDLPSGIDGLLSVSPYYNKPIQKGIVAHYKILAESTELPIILYNVPGRTGSNMLSDTTLELSSIENIVAMKEASGDLLQVMEIIKHKPEGFDLLSGDDALTVPMMAMGGSGVISVVANAFPKKFSDMIHACQKSDFKLANQLHYDLLYVTNLFFKEGNPGGVKVALEEIGLMEETMRLPLYPVSEELRMKIINETKRLLK